MSWGGNRSGEKWTFRSVSWPGFEEGRDVWQVTGGTASLGAFTDLKATGSIELKGDEAIERGNLIRVYYAFTGDNGETVSRALMTAFPELGTMEHDGPMKIGTAELHGVLVVISVDKPGKPYVVSAGTNAVAKAKAIAEEHRLPVNATPSAYELANDHVFDVETSYLGIVNWLLDAAGYSSAYPDAMGTVQMHPYVEPLRRSPVWTFADDGRSAMKPRFGTSDNIADTPNVVRLWYEDDSCGLFAEASNVDPMSEASIPVLGRVNPEIDNVTELTGNGFSAKLANLKELARKSLIDKSTRIDYVEVPCLYVPVEPNDCIAVEDSSAGVSFVGSVTTVDVDFECGAPCTVKARRLLKPDFDVSVSGEVDWHV